MPSTLSNLAAGFFRTDPREGFTLLEMLVALAILSLALTTIPQSIADARLSIDRSQDWMEARLVADAVIHQELRGAALRPGAYQGSIGGRRWSALVREDRRLDAAATGGALFHAQVTVAVGRGRRLELDTLLLGARP